MPTRDAVPRSPRPAIAAALVMLAIVLFGCSSGAAAPSSPAASADPTKDKLAQVLARGTLVLSTDPEYPPQSFLVEGATRVQGTKCAENEMTATEVAGYDADTGKLVAEKLGVEACFVAPAWDLIKEGGWSDRWDVSWASGALTAERMGRLYVTQPYYSTPHNFFVQADSPIKDATELSGKQIGACSGCTHELYLKGTLDLPGETLDYPVKDPVVVTFASEPPGLEALARGEIDAFLAGEPVGTEQIKAGLPIRMLPTPAYHTQKTGYADRSSGLDQVAFLDRVDTILDGLHADGTLKALSMQYFGVDYATAAGEFDLDAIGQQIP